MSDLGALSPTARLAGAIEGVAAADWDALVPAGQPFARHAFLALMENSGSAGRRTGWQPLHLLVEQAGNLIAAAPLYAKSNSWGEYVFDHGWAEALQRAGGQYYPKLQIAVPFTPVPGSRLLARDDASREALARALPSVVSQTDVSSLHVTFCAEEEAELLEENGFLRRRGIQFHWHNHGYATFDDFLGSLRSEKRKMIRKERAAVASSDIAVEVLEGGDAVQALEDFFPFYRATVDRRWGSAYLTRKFFQRLGREMPGEVVLVRATRDGQMVAAALNLLAGDTLYGRLWGSLDEFRFLHFECCYYAAIEHAIRRGLARVEAGAQGTHKLMRGYAPVWTHSAHWIADPGLRAGVGRFLEAERAEQEEQIASYAAMLPYRNETAS